MQPENSKSCWILHIKCCYLLNVSKIILLAGKEKRRKETQPSCFISDDPLGLTKTSTVLKILWVHATSKAWEALHGWAPYFCIRSPAFISLVLFCVLVTSAPSQSSWSSPERLLEPSNKKKNALELKNSLHEGKILWGKKWANFKKKITVVMLHYNGFHLPNT